jgi:hypothetical protein
MLVTKSKLAGALILTVSLLGTGLGVAGARAQAPKADAAKAAEDPKDRALREKLAQTIELKKGIGPNATLQDALDFLSDRYQFKVTIDSKAFVAGGQAKPEEEAVQLPRMSAVGLASALSLVAGQVSLNNGTIGCWRIRGGVVVVTTDVLPEFFDSPAAPGLRKKLDTPITLDKGIPAKSTLNDALGLLCEKYDLPLVVDVGSFEAIGVQKLPEAPVGLPAQKDVKLVDVLGALVAQVKGENFAGGIVVCRDFLVVVPQHTQIAKKEPLTAAQLDKLWDWLNSTTPGEGLLAVRTLCARPQQTVPWLRERVRPVQAAEKLDAALVAKLVAGMEAKTFEERDKATEELEKLGPPVPPALRKRLQNKPPRELEPRLEALINRVDRQLRAVRALRVLEHINTPEARQLLEAMAKGAADTRPTEEAKAALQRQGK